MENRSRSTAISFNLLSGIFYDRVIISRAVSVTRYSYERISGEVMKDTILVIIGLIIVAAVITVIIVCKVKYNKLEAEILSTLGLSGWNNAPYYDDRIVVKSRQTLEKYDVIKYFKDDRDNFDKVKEHLKYKDSVIVKLSGFLADNEFVERAYYGKFRGIIESEIANASAFRVDVDYISSAGNLLGRKELEITRETVKALLDNPELYMGKGEFNRLVKEQQKTELNQKHKVFYDKVNEIVDFTAEKKESMVIRGTKEKLDNLIAQLFDRTVNSIQKIKSSDSDEWGVIAKYITGINKEIKQIVADNQRILDYYDSSEFAKLKSVCNALMSSQREFNEYINEKVQSISTLFGTRVMRNETVTEDEYNYIRPYKKTITPFTAEVSATVFASAENNPMAYIVKFFYPNKEQYPEQIQKLQLLVEELETLREAKQIIENYKQDYQQYLKDVPDYILEQDEAGFYSRLGFAYIDESVLTVEYKFIYTSGGGFAQRFFTVPMTEANIVELINLLESKLTASAFSKEQRQLMTKKLREYIKNRDNYTCCNCGNSTHVEPNLLLEIDHIIPIAKGGVTEEANLQTLCWKCNREKGDKLL